ncbi:MAG: hypothetical protein J2P17_04810 [Mycobacterium sp.]|nr:hypothetical protein [Mycobacterium sp.]
MARLVRDTGRAAESVIGLFREYRDGHGRDEETAAAQAVSDLIEGAQASYELAHL